MPFDVDQVAFFSSDFVEFLAAFITMAITFAILIVLGKWWER